LKKLELQLSAIFIFLALLLRIPPQVNANESQPTCYIRDNFCYECIYDLKTGYSETFLYHIVEIEFNDLPIGVHNITAVLTTEENLRFIYPLGSIASPPTNSCKNGEITVDVSVVDSWFELRIGLNGTQVFADPVNLLGLPYGQNVHILDKNGQLNLAFWFNTSDFLKSCRFSFSPQGNVEIERLDMYTDLQMDDMWHYSREVTCWFSNISRGNRQMVAKTWVNSMSGTLDLEVTATQDNPSIPIGCYFDSNLVIANDVSVATYFLRNLRFSLMEEPFYFYTDESEYCLNFTAPEEFVLRVDANSREEIDYLIFDADIQSFSVAQATFLGEPCYQFAFKTTSAFNCCVGLKLRGKEWFISPKNMTLASIPIGIKENYLSASSSYDGEYFDINNQFVQQWATQLVQNETNPYVIALTIFQNVTETLDFPPNWRELEKTNAFNESVSQVLKDKIGVCRHFARVYAALSICSGLPARTVRGTAFSYLNETWKKNHEWVEVYLPGCGWVTIDPSWGDSLGMLEFCCLDDKHAKSTYWTYIEDTLNVTYADVAFRTNAGLASSKALIQMIQYCKKLLENRSVEIEEAEVLLDKATALVTIGAIHEALLDVAAAYLLITADTSKMTSLNNELIYIIALESVILLIASIFVLCKTNLRSRILQILHKHKTG